MKKSIIFASCLAVSLLGVTSCEDFFDRSPEDKFAAEKFFASETDLVYYTNGLIDAALPSASSIALGEDAYTDLCGTKESEKFFWPDKYTSATASGWTYSTWSFLRQVGYMIDNLPNAKGKVSDEIYNHYEGVARFFRAISTFNKVKKFGDVYWIDHVVSPSDSTILYGTRQDREMIMHNVIEDLKFACEHCLTSGSNIHTNGRIYINKYVALAYASKVCLFEGTYRKYHNTNPSTGKKWNGQYESSTELLELAMKYAGELMDTRAFSLNPNYASLFTSTTLPTDEVIWGRSYSDDLGVRHNTTYSYCSTTSSQLYSPTKDYVMMFLTKSGKPVVSGEVSVTEEFTNRDKRLAACVLAPGMKKKDQSGAAVDFAPDFTWTTSGYVWVKWIMAEYSAMNSSNNTSCNALPVLRYAEVLLNYAEAAEELGKMTPEIWDATIGKIRTVHGGLESTGYPTAGAGYQADTWLRNYYTKDVAHPVSLTDAALEIRRERATELMFELDNRYDDLMRWNMGDLIERRYNHVGWKGIYITPEEAANGFNFNGKHYTISATKTAGETNYKITTAADKAFTLSNGSYGYLIYNYKLQWDDKMYLYPIPTTAANVNPNLGQNEGWQWM